MSWSCRKWVTYVEYVAEKKEILYGVTFKEYCTLNGNILYKEYVSETGVHFWERLEGDVLEFWDSRNSTSRFVKGV